LISTSYQFRATATLQWRFLWLVHSKFICGITGVVRDGDGQVLLLRHRLWPPGQQWGFPTGYAIKGERHEDTIAREVREETGLTVKAGRFLKVRSGFKYRIEIYYEANLIFLLLSQLLLYAFTGILSNEASASLDFVAGVAGNSLSPPNDVSGAVARA